MGCEPLGGDCERATGTGNPAPHAYIRPRSSRAAETPSNHCERTYMHWLCRDAACLRCAPRRRRPNASSPSRRPRRSSDPAARAGRNPRLHRVGARQPTSLAPNRGLSIRSDAPQSRQPAAQFRPTFPLRRSQPSTERPEPFGEACPRCARSIRSASSEADPPVRANVRIGAPPREEGRFPSASNEPHRPAAARTASCTACPCLPQNATSPRPRRLGIPELGGGPPGSWGFRAGVAQRMRAPRRGPRSATSAAGRRSERFGSTSVDGMSEGRPARLLRDS